MTHQQVKLVLQFACGLFLLLGIEMLASAASVPSGLGTVAARVRKTSVGPMAQLITAISYAGGMGCVVGGVVKMWQYKQNPTQTQIGMPITLIAVGGAMLFIPSVFTATGTTFFSGGVAAGISGITSFS